MMRAWKRPAQVLVLVLALLFVLLLLRSQWQELQAYPWRLRPTWLLLSALCMAAGWALEVSVWRDLLRLLGGALPYGAAIRIWFLSAIVRYIPGNVWQPLGMTLLVRRHGIRAQATVTSIALYQAVNLLSVAFIAALYFPLTRNLGLLTDLIGPSSAYFVALAALPAFIFLWRPLWLIRIINVILERAGRDPLPIALTSGRLLRALFWTSWTWVLQGGSFTALTLALTDLTLADLPRVWPHLLVAYPVAYAIGYISFITPSGLAVREGAAYLMLAPVLGGAPATIVSLAMRIWLTLGELTGAGLSLLSRPGLRATPVGHSLSAPVNGDPPIRH
ncbi:MAG: UPF0104 family protein [Caldilineae bacterium]|nr:MAG: UPF0104 family protein [Caldilineae bacterium]